MSKKSIKLNMVLNAIKGLMGVIFPFITYPYILRVLGLDNVGRFTFSDSYISYYVLLAGLGVGTYAVREGARVRNEKEKINTLTSQIFTINIISMIVSLLLLILTIVFIPPLYKYRALLLVLSLQVILKTVGIEWIYSIYEDYAFVTIRSICFQILSLVLMFIFVRKPEDTVIYACIVVFSSGIANLINFVYSRKYCHVGIVKNLDLKRHIKPILILFAMTATVTVYVNSDILILNFMCGDEADTIVGIYSVSTKVYTVIKTILSSIIVVSIPRLSSILGSGDKEKFNEVATDVYKTLLAVMLPSMVGIILLRKEIVLIVSGTEDCLPATSSLALLSIAIVFCMGAWFWGQCVLVPMKLDKKIFTITIISALINIILNFILIPFWQENAAAFTTILAEAFSFVGTYYIGKEYAKIDKMGSYLIKVLVGCAGIIAVVLLIRMLNLNMIMFVISSIAASAILYFLIELILKNEALIPLLRKLKRKK